MDTQLELDAVKAQLAATQAILLQMLKDSNDLLRALDKSMDFLYSPDRPSHLIHKLSATGVKARDYIGPHGLWDLTNDPEEAAILKKILTEDINNESGA